MHNEAPHITNSEGLLIRTPRRYDWLVWLFTLGRERRLRDKILRLAKPRLGERILDLGCGTGTLAMMAKEKVGPQGTVTGLDASEEMVAYAREKAARKGVDATFVKGTVQALPFGDGAFDAVQVAPSGSGDVPDEPGGVRAVVLGVAHPHTGRDGSEALAEAKNILMHRGNTPRVYRNTLVFMAAETRQLDSLKDAMRASLAWGEIVREKKRLDLKESESALAEGKLADAKEAAKTSLKECWCYLIYPHQESAQAEIGWTVSKVPAQDGLLSRSSKKLVNDEGLLPELGPARLDRDLQKYIWNDNLHLSLKDVSEYLSRYTYLPRIKNQVVLVKAVQAAVAGMFPGPFAYAERWDDVGQKYIGLVIEKAANPHVVIDSDSVIVKPDVAIAYRPTEKGETGKGGVSEAAGTNGEGVGGDGATDEGTTAGARSGGKGEALPTRFLGTVMISPDRPARDIHQIVEAIVEKLTTIPGSEVLLKLEIDAEVPSGLDRAKVRTLLENANTLGFIDKLVR